MIPSLLLTAVASAGTGTYGLTLSAQGVAEPGTTLDFSVEGAQPGATVWVALGFQEQVGALCPPVLQGGCVDLASPRLLRTLTADAAGEATFQVTVPSTVARGAAAWFQAVSADATSNTVVRFRTADSGDQTIERVLRGQLADDGNRRGYFGFRLLGESTGFDRCAGGFSIGDDPTLAITPCPDCEFAFATPGATDWAEWTDAGSACPLLYGTDLAPYYTFPYPLALGLDLDYGTVDVGVVDATGTSWFGYAAPATFDPGSGRFSATLVSYPYYRYGPY